MSITSITYSVCRAANHKRIRHSPDGVQLIEECPHCCMAWLLGMGGRVARLTGSTYELRLHNQRKHLILDDHEHPRT